MTSNDDVQKDDYVSEYYLVRSSALPDVYNNVMKVKELLQSGNASSVNDAVKQVGMSRSAFYKYRDDIEIWVNPLEQDVITLVISFSSSSDALSEILIELGKSGHKILNISQSIPRGGFTDIMISCNLNPNNKDMLTLRRALSRIVGVRQVEILTE